MVRLSMAPGLAILLLAILLSGCSRAPEPVPTASGSPAPDLSARPWGLTESLLTSLASKDWRGAEGLLSSEAVNWRQPQRLSELAQQWQGCQPYDEVITGRHATVGVGKETNRSQGKLHFEKSGERWLIVDIRLPE